MVLEFLADLITRTFPCHYLINIVLHHHEVAQAFYDIRIF